MTVESLGSLTVGAVCPATVAAVASVESLLIPTGTKVAELQARLAIAVTPPAMPDLATLSASVALGLVGYNPITALAALVDSIPTLNAEIALATLPITAANLAIAPITAAVGVGGVRAYAFDGRADDLGDELGEAVTDDISDATQVRALVIVTVSDAQWAAITALLKTSP